MRCVWELWPTRILVFRVGSIAASWRRRRGMADEESGGLPSRPGKKRQFDFCLGFGRLVNVTTGLSAMLCLVAHAMKLHEGPDFNTVRLFFRHGYCICLSTRSAYANQLWAASIQPSTLLGIRVAVGSQRADRHLYGCTFAIWRFHDRDALVVGRHSGHSRNSCGLEWKVRCHRRHDRTSVSS